MAGVNFLPIQQGTGDPSPSNVRPISPGLTITGIGDIYGGYLDVAHGTVVGTIALKNLATVEWTADPNRAGVYYGNFGSDRKSVSDIAACSVFEARNETVSTDRDNYISGYSSYSGASPFFRCAAWDGYNRAQVQEALSGQYAAFILATPITHTLTSAQLAEAMQQLNVHPASMLERRRRLVMAQPHLVTPAPANPVSFSATLAAPLKGLECAFSPVQAAGTPAPDNVLPISGWTGCNVWRTGTNLWDEQWEGGSIGTDGLDTLDNTKIRSKNYIPISPNTAYYYKTPSTLGLRYYDRNKTHLGSSRNVAVKNGAKTSPANAYYLRFLVVDTTTYNNDISINYPATDTEYHPYTGQTLAVQFPAEAGTIYGGYIDPVRGVARAEWGMTTITEFNGVWGATTNGYAVYENMPIAKSGTAAKCNMFKESRQGYANMPLYSFIGGSGTSNTWTFVLPDTVTSLQEANAWLAAQSEPLVVVYTLATPIIYPLTPAQLKTLKGANVLYTSLNGNVSPIYWTN